MDQRPFFKKAYNVPEDDLPISFRILH